MRNVIALAMALLLSMPMSSHAQFTSTPNKSLKKPTLGLNLPLTDPNNPAKQFNDNLDVIDQQFFADVSTLGTNGTYTTLEAAVTALCPTGDTSPEKTLIIPVVTAVAANTTVCKPLTLEFTGAGSLEPVVSVTVTVNGPVISAKPLADITGGAGTVTFGTQLLNMPSGNSSGDVSGIIDGTIVDADINSGAAIVDTKLATISTSGKVSDSALSTNVALKNAANVFTQNLEVDKALPRVILDKTASSERIGLQFQLNGINEGFFLFQDSVDEFQFVDRLGITQMSIVEATGVMNKGKVPLLRIRTAADAAVFDASDNMMNIGFIRNKTTSGITASVTQTQGSGALTSTVNEISTVATTNDTVTLPTAVAGTNVIVINEGANTLQIFPASGDDLGSGLNIPTTLNAGSKVTFTAYDATNWKAGTAAAAAPSAASAAITGFAVSNWTERSNPQNQILHGITHNGTNLFVAVGAGAFDAYIATSSDGITWTERTNPKGGQLEDVVWNGTLYLAVGAMDGVDSYMVTSSTGSTWTERANPKTVDLFGVVWDGTQFVAVGDADVTDAYIITATNVNSWTEQANPKNFRLYDVDYNGTDLFVAVGDADGTDAYIITSPNGSSWTERTNPKNFGLSGVAYGNGLWVAVGGPDGTDSYIVTSPDGITWTERSTLKNAQLNDVIWNGDLFIAVGPFHEVDSYIVTSPDGITWTERENPRNLNLNAIAWGTNKFVSVGTTDGSDAYIITSLNTK